jgi:hypothetical protein
MRTTYRNGDEISLTSCGCDGCSPSTINGTLCHEQGCPDAWRDYSVECFECGCDFQPEHRGQQTCPDCLSDERDGYCGCGLPLDECGQCPSSYLEETCPYV